MASRQAAQSPDGGAEPPPNPRIPLICWLMTGGTGLPPTAANFCRMASERKAVYREEKARKAAFAELQEKWPATGLAGGSGSGGGRRRKPGRREELMRLYGPRGTARGSGNGGENHRANVGNNSDGGDGNGDGTNGDGAQ